MTGETPAAAGCRPADVAAPRSAPAPGRYARAALSYLAEPGDQLLGTLLRRCGPERVLAAITAGPDGVSALSGTGHPLPGLDRALQRWAARSDLVPAAASLAWWESAGYRIVCPGDPEWPTQLDDLGAARPVMLWLYGTADLRFSCLRSVSVVGSRAATAYGGHVGGEISAALAERGWTVISGGAYGIDAAAHRGALAVGGCTIAVLASGLRFGYPKGHKDLFRAIAGTGVLVSEHPPDQAPNRPGFLVRNRVIAALSRGTVVVEAAVRSGALSTARHAGELNRAVMAVPGPVTTPQSAGCHGLIRDAGAVLVTSAQDVIELVAPLGQAGIAQAGDEGGPGQSATGQARASLEHGCPGENGRATARQAAPPAVPAEALDPTAAAVLAAVPARSGRGTATIASLAGVDLDTAVRCLGLLAAVGHVARSDRGWRLRRKE